MKLLDSSVLIAFLNERDALHARAVALDLSNSVFNEFVFLEVSNVIQKQIKDKLVVMDILKNLVTDQNLIFVSRQDLINSLDVFSKYYPKLSFTDALLIVQSKAFGVELLTFDKELEKAVKIG